jgi:hypothetical protein
VDHLVGGCIIPPDLNNWYAIPVPKDVETKGELTLQVHFEDYLGKKYQSNHNGVFQNSTWQIKSQKRIQV